MAMAWSRKSSKTPQTNIDSEIQRMVEYIEQDGLEKVEEIDLKSEEEFAMEKNKVRDKALIQIANHYDKLEEKINRETKAEYCRIAHHSRLDFLNAENEVLNEIRIAAKERLQNIHCEDNKDAYKKVLTALILQGIFKLMEPGIIVKFHKDDKDIIDDCLKKAKRTYKDKTRKEIEINKSEEYLNDEQIGGVVISGKSDRITVNNTLEARFYIIAEKPDSVVLPEFRRMLFGTNINRKHFD